MMICGKIAICSFVDGDTCLLDERPETNDAVDARTRRTAAHRAAGVDEEINPNVDEWEEAGQFPAHHVMKLLGDAGLIGISRPTDYGGLDLDYSYEVACAEE